MSDSSRKLSLIALVVSIAAAVLAVLGLVNSLRPAGGAAAEDVQYVLYLGTNDKDTNEPVLPPEEARARLEDILVAHFGGYTVQEAAGGWLDGDTVCQEYTLVIYLSDTDPASVHAAADELIDVFHQSSVLIQTNPTTTEFYAG